MLLRLQRYNIAVQYKPGPQMYVADHLSIAFDFSHIAWSEKHKRHGAHRDGSRPQERPQGHRECSKAQTFQKKGGW